MLSAPATPTVLLVDDDAGLRAALGSILTSFGYHVLTAACSESAYALIGSTPVDAVLLDVRLPTMSGLALYTAIVSRWPRLHDSIAFLTAEADASDVSAWLEVHRCTVFEKPCAVADVLAWVAAATRPREDLKRASS
jgi:DNA-binding response OmpR family regulator